MIAKTYHIIKLVPALILVGTFLFACENDVKEVEEITSHIKLPVEVATDVDLTYSEYGIIKVRLKAKKMERYNGNNPYVEAKDGVTILFYDSIGVEASRLEAKYAINRINKKIMEARYDVVVSNSKNEKLYTDHLIWDENERTLKSEEFVKIQTEDEIVTGKGFEAAEDFSWYKVKDVSATINLKEEKDSLNN